MLGTTYEEFVGSSSQSEFIRRFIKDAALSSKPIVLLGEPGVGKELVARSVHKESPRPDQPFLMIDCSLYYERELKRELFGYRGAGQAAKSRKGLLEFAARGTCYLSRVEEMTPAIQEDLLRFVRCGRFCRLGDGREIHSRVRVIVSSDKNLEGFVSGGLFNSELHAELAQHSLMIPPLRERAEDLEALVRSLADYYSRQRALTCSPTFTAEAFEILKSYPWPGNLDELKDEVHRAVDALDGTSPLIGRERLSFEICSYWQGHRGDPETRKVIEELDGYIREFKVLSRLDAEFGDILLNVDHWPASAKTFSRQGDGDY